MRNMEIKFKPILFSTEMVQAILDGRKTQTRRIVKNQPDPEAYYEAKFDGEKLIWDYNLGEENPSQKPKYEIGDILWVRETFYVDQDCIQGSYAHEEGEPVKFPPHILEGGFRRCVQFKADYPNVNFTWKPSIFMPRSAARIFLKVTNVRCERLQDISCQDCKQEGVVYYKQDNIDVDDILALEAFMKLWQKINAKKHPWESNPWVWVYNFKRIEKPQNFS